ncbi:unnamed protein product [Euphydryas editha]|uniref:t-SNARE coiled-coil homology domain-containing protein n=1 Tax=Euphydryas editha TaxID=104508 RepID=A0AAU9UGP9_EUPED|nr:unnamed protein product [Euphydryas editha]
MYNVSIYIEIKKKDYSSPISIPSPSEATPVASSALSTDSVGVLAEPQQIQLQVDEQELELREREAVLRGWRELQAEVRALHDTWQHVQAAALAQRDQAEVRALHDTWQHVQAAALAQRDQVEAVATNIDTSADNVQAARENLALSEKLKAGAWGAGGALAGGLVGGPVGLLLGAKAGAAALLAGSALGYVGARLLGRRRAQQLAPAREQRAGDKKEL